MAPAGHGEGLLAGLRVLEHLDRLARFGSEDREGALAARGRSVPVVDPNAVQHDVVHDMRER